jgi:hypothetical protein
LLIPEGSLSFNMSFNIKIWQMTGREWRNKNLFISVRGTTKNYNWCFLGLDYWHNSNPAVRNFKLREINWGIFMLNIIITVTLFCELHKIPL